MKKLLSIIILCFVLILPIPPPLHLPIFSSWAGVTILGGRVSGGGEECADSSCTGFLVCQNFEGAGYDNSESWTESIGTNGICDEDDTTATIGRGSQQLKIYAGDSGQNTKTNMTHTAQDEVYGHFMFKTADATPSADTYIWRALNTSSNNSFSIQYTTGGALKFNHGTGNATTVGTLSDNTWYHIWFHWVISTGSDGVYSVAFSTDRDEPTSGDNYASGSNGTLTVQVNRGVRPYADLQATGYYDQILLRTTSIGTVCE